jgi:hypothetical protein
MLIYCFGNSHVWSLVGGFCKQADRIESSDEDLEFLGWKLGDSGATAYGLMKKGSATRAGENIIKILDEEPGKKDVLMVFGAVDVIVHIGKHGQDEDTEVANAINKYNEYLKILEARNDTGLILVTSTVAYSHNFKPHDHERIKRISAKWNKSLQDICVGSIVYVDWYDCVDTFNASKRDGEVDDNLERNPADPNEMHMSLDVRPILIKSIRSAILRYDS